MSVDVGHLGRNCIDLWKDKAFNSSFDTLRSGLLLCWKSNIRVQLFQLNEAGEKYQLEHNNILEVGTAAIAKADLASFWEWDIGFAQFFWRWPEDYQESAQKIIALIFNSVPQRNLDAQPLYEDEEMQKKV